MRKALPALAVFCISWLFAGPSAIGQERGGYLGLEVVGNHVVYTRRYTPAERAGLMPGDEILAIDSKSVQGLGRDAIGRLIDGSPGESVTISARRGETQFVVIMATRDPMPAMSPSIFAQAKECYELGVKQRELGRPNESKAAMERALSLDPGGEIGKKAKCYILTQLPLYPVPADALRLNNYGWNLDRSSRDAEAEKIFQECVRRYPNFEWPRNNLAGIYRCARKFREANQLIDGTLSMHPQYLSAWRERANIREAEGDLKGALLCIRKAVSLDPDDKDARKRCAEIEAELHK